MCKYNALSNVEAKPVASLFSISFLVFQVFVFSSKKV